MKNEDEYENARVQIISRPESEETGEHTICRFDDDRCLWKPRNARRFRRNGFGSCSHSFLKDLINQIVMIYK